MARVFIEADSLTTGELRAALRALSQVNQSDGPHPPDLSRKDGKGRAFVGLNGPECWSLRSIALYPNQAIGVIESMTRASWSTLAAKLTPPDDMFGPISVGDLDEPLSASEVRALEQDAENGPAS